MAPSKTENGSLNGSTEFGENIVKELKKEEKQEESSVAKLSETEEMVLKTFRILIADLCQQFGGGHPGYVVSEDVSRSVLMRIGEQ